MEDFDENAFTTHSHVEVDAHVNTKNSENIEVYRLGVEVAWSITTQLHEAVELVVQEAWQESLLPREEEETNGEVDNGPPLDNSTIHKKPPDNRIVLLELFGSRVVNCNVTKRNCVAMLRYCHNVASHHHDGLQHCYYSGIN
jgi:hypothetical protein